MQFDRESLLHLRTCKTRADVRSWDQDIPLLEEDNDSISSWSGVSVHNNRVSKLYITGNDSICGKVYIPDTIGDSRGFEFLTHLQIHANYKNLGGFIPHWIGNLINLTHIDLSNNELIGIIPETFNNLINLKDLCLHRNKLRGNIDEIPLENCKNLKRVTLYENNFRKSKERIARLREKLSGYADLAGEEREIEDDNEEDDEYYREYNGHFITNNSGHLFSCNIS